jgi:Protein of unknown function (DUF2281)
MSPLQQELIQTIAVAPEDAIAQTLHYLQTLLQAPIVSQQTPTTPLRKRRIAGLHRNSIVIQEGFDDPLPDSFWLGEME